ncbi:mandelate racemase/muconate lactonizing enzyme family protein [Bacillus sp. MRMR6]|uniref:mandelate racemase/muconate lactonizing enzyme family protein n=1 Tax=Bacillus sp. MRMR6 TaxID=1928617 RepID=UPI000953294A|nr:mandelate racemase/muconate lactonizing enzyme family protein [Bacillus sp. MRMR6]OLS33866.1 hypothetical protein BTR25_23685 [Bacillus sp. MRMR6]
MKIVDIKATNLEIPYDVEYRPAWQPGLVRKSRDFTLVRVYTEDGIVGYSGTDGYHAHTIETKVKPYLIGKDVFATEQHARVLRNAGVMWFIDLAFWDIIGKAANLPLYKLWGYTRDKVKAYASTAELGTPENRAELAARYKEEGFKAMKIRLHHEEMKDDLALIDSVMNAAPDLEFMVDANQATSLPSPSQGVVWDYRRALATAKELEDRNVVWLEEPLSRYDFPNLIRLRENTSIHIAGGEKNLGLHEFRWLIEKGVYDIIQPDITMSEGISQLRKIAAMTEMNKLHFVPHHGLSGFGLAGVVHLCCSTPGYMWLEMMYEPPTRTIETYQQLGGIIEDKVWIDKEGYVHAINKPGLGLDVNEAMIDKYTV